MVFGSVECFEGLDIRVHGLHEEYINEVMQRYIREMERGLMEGLNFWSDPDDGDSSAIQFRAMSDFGVMPLAPAKLIINPGSA